MNVVRSAAALASAAVLTLGTVTAAVAALGKPGSEPCAKEQAQVTRAQEQLAHVTAVFAHQKTKVERLEERLAAATTDSERAKLQAKLDKALAHKQHTAKAKKAQQQRLAKASQRLADCQADQAPTTTS